jgi:hypothetical protein
VKRTFLTVLAAVTLVVAAASPVRAHSGVNANDHLRSRVVTAPAGIEASVAADGSAITVSAAGTVTVLGYDDEPFLMFAGGQVLDNANSLTTYDARPGVMTTMPPSAGSSDAEPAWEVAGPAPYSWSDHRIEWSAALPQAVMDAPKKPHTVSTWSIPVLVDGERAAITGRIDWVPVTDSVGLTLAVCSIVLMVVVIGAGAIAFPRRKREKVAP